MKAFTGTLIMALLALPPAHGQQRQSEGDGSKLFGDVCLNCHGNSLVQAAPPPAVIKQMTPERIYLALTEGSMKTQAKDLTDRQKREIAEFMGGRRMGATESGDAKNMPNRCSGNAVITDIAAAPAWNGWGVDFSNTRFQTAKAADLTPGQVSRLKLKWAFALPGSISVYGQPTIVAGKVFVSSDTGIVYALDANSGCVHWSFQAQSGVRTAISVGKLGATTRHAAYFGDIHGNAYAVDVSNGELLWKTSVDSHPLARITGAPKLHANRLYVPVASLEEPESAGLKYPCCTFRGSMVALNAETGKQVWKTYVIQETPTMRKTAAGVAFQGPSGGGVWDSPTIDLKRRALYFGTGNNFSDPPTKTSDAVMALDMDTGKVLWVVQEYEGDVWHTGCQSVRYGTPPVQPGRGGPPGGRGQAPRPADYYCPDVQHPDWDVSVSPIQTTLPDGRSAVIVGQKSGVVWAHDVDKKGAVIWKQDVARIVPGGGGEIVFGGAVDDQNAYFNLRSGGIVALQLSTGMEKWYRPLPPQESMAQHRGLSSAVTVIPGVVFSGGLDGMLRAFSANDGNLIWSFNTAAEFETVNGVKAKGGSIGAPGPTVAQGMVLIGSGYTGFQGGSPGNVLLAFMPYDRIPAVPGGRVRGAF